MSYCCMATCLAHRREVFIQPAWRQWVHTDCWPCDALAGAPVYPEDLGLPRNARGRRATSLAAAPGPTT